MKMIVPDPSLQFASLVSTVDKLTSKDPLFLHRLHAVITEKISEVRERERELEVVVPGDVRVAAMTQRDSKKASNVSEIEGGYFMTDGGCRRGGLCSNKHVKHLPKQGKCCNCGGTGHRAIECRTQLKEPTEKRNFQKPKVSRAVEVAEESERESVSRIVAATGRDILGELVAGATHEPVGLRDCQKIPTGTRPCKLQLAIGHVDGWGSADGVVYSDSDTELPSIFRLTQLLLSVIRVGV